MTQGWGRRAATLTVMIAVMASPAAAQRPYDEVVRDLKSTDPDTRVAALRVLGAASYPESMAPIASLLTDPLDAIQFETINTLLGFVLVDKVATKKRVALVVEVRDKTSAQAAFDMGPFVLLPRPVVPEVVHGHQGAMRDDNPRVRLEATYALGVLARPPVDAAVADILGAALRDPEVKIRIAAARVAGGLRAIAAGEALIEAVNDKNPEVKVAALRAIGDVKDLRALQALREQYEFYQKGPIAEAAFDALARIGHESSVPVFQAQLTSKHTLMRRWAAEGLGRSGSAALSLPTLDDGVAKEKDQATRLAFAFALQSVGRPQLPLLVEGLRNEQTEAQAMAYLVELGQPVARPLGASLADPDAKQRARVAMTLGLIGGQDAIAALDRAKQDADTDTARAIERALARARMR